MTELTRRALITNGGIAVLASGTLVLAGCAPAPRPVESGRGPSSRGPGQVPPQQLPVASPLPPGTELAQVSAVPVGGTAAATVDGQEFLLAQPVTGTVVAFSAICTHQGCLVAAAGDEFDCSCHGSRFAAATGAVLNGPAVRPLEAIAVTVAGGAVVIA